MKKNLLFAVCIAASCQFLPAYSFSQGTWVQKQNFGFPTGTARQDAVDFSIGSKGYIGTGYDGTARQDFWEWNQTTNVWTQDATFGGPARQKAVGFSIGTKGYIGTGTDGGSSTYYNDLWEYDPSTNLWTAKTSFPGGARQGAVGFSIGTKGYIGTGVGAGGTYYNDFKEFDPANTSNGNDIHGNPMGAWTAKPSFPGTPRWAAAGFSIGTKGYIGTGNDGVNKQDFYEFDQVNNTWTAKTNFGGTARYFAVGFAIGTQGYIGTGHDGSYKQDLWKWDQGTDTWTLTASFGGMGRYGATGFSIGTKGYIGTGFNPLYPFGYFNDFWEYTPSDFPSAQLCFSAASTYSIGTGTSPRGICSADFNNDGKMDLATADNTSNNVAILMGNGTGTFTFSVNSPAGSGPVSVISADFNRDGKMDLAVADNGAATVSVLQGNGDGTFQANITSPTGSNPISVISGYFNNDSYLDLATANNGSNNVTVLFGNSAGTFTTTSTYSISTSSPSGITCGYFNNDAYLDLAVANATSSNVAILLGSSAGNFTSGGNFPAGSAGGIVSADFNGDGKADLAVNCTNCNNVYVLLGNGDGTFQTANTFGVGGTNYGICTGDFNGDGKVDLATANLGTNNVAVLQGNGNGTFQTAVNYLLPSGSIPFAICSADFNGDGKPDLAVPNKGLSNVSVLLNTLITGSALKTNVSCYSGNNGTAAATIAVGSAPYTYAWSNGVITSSTTGLIANNYSVTITNTNGCTATASVTITQPSVLAVTASPASTICLLGNTTISCAGGVSGGTLPYTFNWSPSTGLSCTTCASATASPSVTTTYTITVTDANNCTAQASTLVTVISPSITVTPTNVTCNGGSNGSITANVTGGTSPYSWSWQISHDGGLTWTNYATGPSSITGLTAAMYAVTVTDGNNCSSTSTVTITQPLPLQVQVGVGNVLCYSGNNGSANVQIVTGGNFPPYTYQLLVNTTIIQTSPNIGNLIYTFNNLTANNYNVIVTDSHGCTGTYSNVNVTQPNVIAVNTSGNTSICAGGITTISATTVTGGAGPPYNYNWFPSTGLNCTSCTSPAASPTATNNYTLTVTDASGCTAQGNVLVSVNSPTVTANASPSATICAGNSVTLNGLGATSYVWTGGVTNGVGFVPSSTATYTVTGTDGNGCSKTATKNITVNTIPSAPIASSNSPVNIGNTLSLSASNTGTSYSWSGPNSFSSALQNPAIAGVTTAAAGCYSVTATTNGCTSPAGTTCVTVITLAITTSTQSVSCSGGNDGGALVVSVTGGSSPYTYSWNTLPVQTTQAAFNLVAGTYTVTVTDHVGASATAIVTVTQPTPISVFTNPTNVSCYGGNNGTAHAIAGGGTSPYTYSWNSFPVQTTATASNLSAGTYTATVTDANGCTGTNTVAITQPSALTVTMTIVNTDCGSTNGSASTNVTGGTVPYTYSWIPSGPNNLPSGNYSVTVTDSKGCTLTTAFVIGTKPSNFNLAFSGTPQNGASPLPVTFTNSTPNLSNYNFSWYWGDGNNVNNNNATVFYTYNFAGTYDVALIATSIANGCKDTLAKHPYINVTGTGCGYTVTATPSGPINKCQGDTVILTANTNAVAPFTYQWNIGSVAISGETNSTIKVTQGGYYSVTVIKSNCPVTSSAVQVNFTTHPQQPTVTSAGNIVPCLGGAVTLTSSTISGAAYSWNTTPVQTTLSVVVSSSGNYVVTAINSSGCTTASAPFTVNASLAQVPICLVTVDTVLSQNNIIVWDKPAAAPIDSFIIYREISTNNYKPIGHVSYDSLSMFKDTVRTKYFPNTGNPNAGTYRYKIAVRDTCGNYSPMSLYHNTIYIINNSGIFFWPQLYTIENSANPVTSYVLMRDNTSTGNWQPVQSVAGTQQTVTDPQYSTYQNTASWRVQTQWNISCAPTIINPKDPDINSINLNSSRSNVYRLQNPNNVINTNADMIALVYPNPSSGFFTIDLKNNITGSAIIKVFNMMGEEVNRINCTGCSNRTTMDLSKLAGGVYYLQIATHEQTITKKIVIE